MAVMMTFDGAVYCDEFRVRLREHSVELDIVTEVAGQIVARRTDHLPDAAVSQMMAIMGDPKVPIFAQMSDVVDGYIRASLKGADAVADVPADQAAAVAANG